MKDEYYHGLTSDDTIMVYHTNSVERVLYSLVPRNFTLAWGPGHSTPSQGKSPGDEVGFRRVSLFSKSKSGSE